MQQGKERKTKGTCLSCWQILDSNSGMTVLNVTHLKAAWLLVSLLDQLLECPWETARDNHAYPSSRKA